MKVETFDVLSERMGFRNVIEGRVIFSDGTPAPGYPIQVRFARNKRQAYGQGTAITGPDGRYKVRGLASEEFIVSIDKNADDFLPTRVIRIDLRKKKTLNGVDFRFPPGPKITVSVRDAETGRPVSGMEIVTSPRRYTTTRRVAGLTDAKGSVKTQVGYLEVALSLRDPNTSRRYGVAPGYAFYKRFKLAKPQEIRWDVLVYEDSMNPRPATFRGVAVDAAGKPVAGATVKLQRGGQIQTARSDAKGGFQFHTTRIQGHESIKGAAVVFVEKAGMKGVKSLAAQDSWGLIRVALDAKGLASATGRVVDETGKPISGCSITYWEHYPGATISVQPSNGGATDSRGRFQVEGLNADALYRFQFGGRSIAGRLGVTSIPQNPQDVRLQIKRGKTLNLGTVVVPAANGTLAGKVTDTNGNPASKNLLIVVKGRHFMQSTRVGSDGHFEIKNVVNEPLTLRVFVGSGGFTRTSDNSPDLLLARNVKAGDRNMKLVVKMRPVLP